MAVLDLCCAEVGCAGGIAGQFATESGRFDVIRDDRQSWQAVGAASFLDDGVGVFEHLVHGHGVHLAAVVVAGFDGHFEVASSGLGGESVGDDVAGSPLHLNPCEVGHGDPDGAAVDGESDVGGVGVARGNGDDGSLPGAVERLGGPAVGYGEVFVHVIRLAEFGPVWNEVALIC